MSEVMDEMVVVGQAPLFTIIDISSVKKIDCNMNLI